MDNKIFSQETLNETDFKVTFLGTGANGGVPQLDCSCENCTKGETRLRSSLLLELGNRKFLLDCGPDLRQQLLNYSLKLQDISAISITHLHWDHSLGLAELSGGRALEIPIVVPKDIKAQMLVNPSYAYLFNAGFTKFIDEVSGVGFTFIPVLHDRSFPTFAIRVEYNSRRIIYLPDTSEINPELAEYIGGANLVIFDATFLNESKHNHITIRLNAQELHSLNPNVIFTHINHSENPDEVREYLEQFGYVLASDNMYVAVV